MEICNHGMDCYLPNDYLTSIRFRCAIKRYANSTSIINHDTDSCTDDGIRHVAIAEKSVRKMVIEIKKARNYSSLFCYYTSFPFNILFQ